MLQLLLQKLEFNGLAKEMAVSTRDFDDFDTDIEDVNDVAPIIPEPSPSTKLERRRKIEDLFEEKRLREELAEFG
ncbi:hypothetical protein LEWO105114_09270 [Legionella worsleiensis]|uniref:Uncharacterized protein n=1 Tax=Legionella worsleiensis TaxID=45076 RepID=A0A0W1AIQ5_9GAMM|nr:hypothetical protein Lwor_0868 [Legionella worsleiensis]STY33166.1 Uncharacterised protein [Legionella worsleiensis]